MALSAFRADSRKFVDLLFLVWILGIATVHISSPMERDCGVKIISWRLQLFDRYWEIRFIDRWRMMQFADRWRMIQFVDYRRVIQFADYRR